MFNKSSISRFHMKGWHLRVVLCIDPGDQILSQLLGPKQLDLCVLKNALALPSSS